MKDKTVPKLRQDWFLAELKRLKLESPVAELVDKTGFSKGQISKLINKIQYPTAEFLETFCKSFKIDGNELTTYIKEHAGVVTPKEIKELETPEDLKDIVLLMANNVNTLIASVTTDRETVKKRFEKVDANFAEVYTELKSLSGFQDQAVRRLTLIEGRLQKLIMNDPNSGAAVLGKKRRN